MLINTNCHRVNELLTLHVKRRHVKSYHLNQSGSNPKNGKIRKNIKACKEITQITGYVI